MPVRLLALPRHPIVRRGGRSVLVALGVMVLSFAILRLAPGDPALALVGDNATPEELEAMRERLGLNGSLPQQFAEYFLPLLRGDLGTSIVSGQPVADIVADSLPTTLWLISFAMTLALALSLALAVPTATFRFGAPGVLFRVVTSTLLSIPVFFSGQLLILLAAIRWGILPAGGYDPAFPANLGYLLLPALTACGPLVPILLRVLQEFRRRHHGAGVRRVGSGARARRPRDCSGATCSAPRSGRPSP